MLLWRMHFQKLLWNNNGDERGRMARMARAYVGFFCQHPSFYSFYTKYAEFRIDIHETSIDCVGAKPFYIFKNAAEQFLNMKGMPKEKQAAQIIQMWALVQGITMFAVMPSIHNDLKWEEPWIGKVQVDAVNFMFGENVGDLFRIHTDETKVITFKGFTFFQGADKNTGIFFNADKIFVRVPSGHFQNKLAFSHTDFYIKRLQISKDLMPLSFFLCNITDDQGIGCNGFP